MEEYTQMLRIAIVTARNAPAHERLINTLSIAGIDADELFLLGGIEKKLVLDVLKPHIFFDDQIGHLEPASVSTPSVHVPFGVANVG
jgi:5'-nucleotidase